MRLKIYLSVIPLLYLLSAFYSLPEKELSGMVPPKESSRDSIVTCVDSIYAKYTAGLREFNDLTYLGPYKPDSVKWLNLCGKDLTNRHLDGKLLSKMKNIQVLDLGFRDFYTIKSFVLNDDEPSEAKKKKMDRDVAGGWEYYYKNKIGYKEEVSVVRKGNSISELPKEIAALKKLKLLVLCGNNIPPEDVTALRKKMPNCLIVYDK
jgi:hypothetical protein